MKIIINAYQYSSSITGTDRMAYNFLSELQKIDRTNEYFVVCSSEDYIQKSIVSENFKILQPKHYVQNGFVRRIVNKIWRETLVSRLLPIKADVYYSFHNMRLPKKRLAGRMIASNLDLIPLALDEYSELFPGVIDEINSSARMADEFISISNFSKSELVRLLGTNEAKVNVIPLAPDRDFLKTTKKVLETPKNYLLTIGGSEPRKNVLTVAQAFSELPEDVQEQNPLLIIGEEWHGRKLEELKLSPHVKLLGYVDNATLSYLYSNAEIFIFASTYEGFGFTILEAMACGTPVITSAGTSLDEVSGDATIKFDSSSKEDLKRKLESLLSDKKLRSKLSVLGKKQADRFSWEASAKQLHKILTKEK